MADKKTCRTILVRGDSVTDRHIYEGDWFDPGTSSHRGTRTHPEPGGAGALQKLLAELFQGFAVARAAARVQAPIDYELEKARADYLRKSGSKDVKDPKLREIPILPEESWRAVMDAAPAPEGALRKHVCSYAVWAPTPIDIPKTPGASSSKDLVWRVTRALGYGEPGSDRDPSKTEDAVRLEGDIDEAASREPEIVVIDDAGLGYRDLASNPRWPSTMDVSNGLEWIVLKVTGPAAQGPFWEHLKQEAEGDTLLDRTVIVVSAEKLRHENVSMSRGLSWERTVEDVRSALVQHPRLCELTLARHLIVAFGIDGALWLERVGTREQPSWTPRLFFDAEGAEGQWQQTMAGWVFGYLSCLTASVVHALVQHLSARASGAAAALSLDRAIPAGLSAMRDLHRFGHGRVADPPLHQPSGFPAPRLADEIRSPQASFSSSPVPWPAIGRGGEVGTWSIVLMSQNPLLSALASVPGQTPSLIGLARLVVLRGLTALADLPHARFGGLVTADRREIETLRSIRQLMLGYGAQRDPNKPLSIGVFGAPGAGKSFGVKQISKEIFGAETWLEFNLSQFNGPSDLIGALHQVRDRVLTGQTPVVFWDEFDSQEYLWLQYLLAPMQDGRFQEGQITHPIGKCVFIFAGGTSHTYVGFGPRPRFDPDGRQETEAYRRFRLRKGTDFHSRLDAHYDVAGPNRITVPAKDSPPHPDDRCDDTDISTPLRRALFISGFLKAPKDLPLDIDPGLLTALLEVPRYLHGSRSLEKILLALKPANPNDPIRRSALLSPAILAMHVSSTKEFDDLCRYDEQTIDERLITKLAAAVHENYLRTVSGKPPNPDFAKHFDLLNETEKETNRAAARRIPSVLGMAGLKIVPGEPNPEENALIRTHLTHHLEVLAEAEHLGWMDERRRAGWTYAAVRDNARLHHNLMVPYSELPQEERRKDREAVLNYPSVLSIAGYKIVFQGAEK